MNRTVYLDYAATAPMRREVLESMFPYFQQSFANPSSVHGPGAEARMAVSAARAEVAAVLHCHPEEVTFTSGGTESDNLAVAGACLPRSNRPAHIVVSSIEHEAVLRSVSQLELLGYTASYAPVDQYGQIDPATIAKLIRPETVLVSCMLANNEVGTIQPISEISRTVRAVNPSALVHTDAVQAAAFLDLDVDELGVDLLTLSGHKIGGPKGTGVLYVRRGVTLQPLIFGGGQENRLRSGTENVPGIVGMASALRLAQKERQSESVRLRRLQDSLIDRVCAASTEVTLTGHPHSRLPNHASFVFWDRTAESVLVDLDIRGVYASSGSACHAGQTNPSYVLLALGYDPVHAKNALRLTLGPETTEEDISFASSVLCDVLEPVSSPSMV